MEGRMDWLESIPTMPEHVLFLTGAGISVDPPSSIPPGIGLTWRAMSEAAGLANDEIEVIEDWFVRCDMPGGFPRFETVLGAVADARGDSALRDLLRDLIDITPNALHGFFAEHLAAGGRHITANIDRGIERAEPSPEPPDRSVHVPLHFHGIAGDLDELGALGITLRNVEGGFPPTTRQRLLEAVPQRAVHVGSFQVSSTT